MRRDPTKPTNLRANMMPSDGYVLTVDGKLKTRYESETEAIATGSKLKQKFPMIRVSIFDPAKQRYSTVESQEKEVSA